MVLLMVKLSVEHNLELICSLYLISFFCFLVWDVRANGCRFSLKKTEESINSMITINNSNSLPTLACASDDGTLSIIDISTKKMVTQVFYI